MPTRPSIKEIFANWNKLSVLLLLLMVVLTLAALDRENSYAEEANLLNQKRLIGEIATMGRDNLELANIQYRGKSNQLLLEHSKLQELYKFDYAGQRLLGYDEAYRADLNELETRIMAFNSAAGAWYDEHDRKLKERQQKLNQARYALLGQIDAMIQKNIGYDYAKFTIERWVVYATAVLVLLMLLNFARRFRAIYLDLYSLYGVEAEGQRRMIVNDEIELLSRRMNRKQSTGDNPAMMDPITGINNYKGLLTAFGDRQAKEGSVLAVCVFEVDDFKELDRQYPKSFTQAILKKIAFMMSLYEQHTDILARTDYSQFAFVLSRGNVQQAIYDCEQIRRSVEEASFRVPEGENIRLTVSGGFVQKSAGFALEDALKLAKDALAKSQAVAPNKIRQV